MALKWQNNTSDSGILRKNDIYENKDDLLVFGYSCKLFRDDEKALLIDQGKHLIPWMGDDSLKIDRYDCRGNLAAKELAAAESRVGAGVSWQHLLSSEELRAERLCDEERYRALHTDEDEEEMYREEELKRLHMAHNASYGQVQFNYDGDSAKKDVTESEETIGARNEEDEPFVPTPLLNIPEGMPLPETKKLNAIIEKTAAFIASQGTQMEILLKAKQAGNRQFDFLSLECPLHRYYSYVLGAIREGRYRPDQQEKQEEKVEEEEHYLHPSLAPVPVESAPCIPSITYKPSADCAYSMLVNQIKGKTKTDTESIDSTETDIAPPGTETLPLPIPKRTPETECTFSKMDVEQLKKYAAHPFQLAHLNQPDISKAAVMYDKNTTIKSNADIALPIVKPAVVEKDKGSFSSGIDSNTNSPKPESVKSTGLKLIHYSDSEEESDSSCSGETHNSTSSIVIPPPDLQVIIDKMASYVAKNGDAFENIVKMKGDPRFYFLNPEHQYYGYYKHKRGFYEQTNKQTASYASDNTEKNDAYKSNDKVKEETEQKSKAPVSFSIKKIKEPEPILPKPALPYESSSDEETTKEIESVDKSHTTEELKQQQPQQQLKASIDTPLIIVASKLPVSESNSNAKVLPASKPLAASKSIASPKPVAAPKAAAAPKPTPPRPVPPPQNDQSIYHIQNDPKASEKVSISEVTIVSSKSHKKSRTLEKSTSEKRSGAMEVNESFDKRKKSKRKRSRSRKRSKRDRSEDIITIEEDASPVDPSDFIDLTDDIEDKKDNPDDLDKNKIQTERKKRAAAFLSSLKSLHSVPAHQQSSLASAMVKTLHTYQDGQDIEERKYRRRRRDESSRRKSKKSRRDSREKSFSESEDEMDKTKYEKSDRRSRHHSSRKHSKKTKKSSSKDERYPESRSHRDDRKKSRSRYEPSSKEKVTIENNAELKNLEEEFKICRKQDKLLTSSLKELVKEARKELISKEPIKMAVDIFSNDSSNEKSPLSSVTPQIPEDNWEKGNSEMDDDSKDSSPDTLSSPSDSE